MTIYLEDSDEKASREVGLNVEKWISALLCEDCKFQIKTGYKKPKDPLLNL